MFKNYLTAAVRNILKSKVFTGINLIGLSIGIVYCILISLYVISDLSFDTFHPDYNNIYMVNQKFKRTAEEAPWLLTPLGFGVAMKTEFLGIVAGNFQLP